MSTPSSSLAPRTFLRVFFALYVVLGLGLIALTPPFQSPDAFAHFDRAVGLSRGDLRSSTSHGTPGDVFPVGVYQTEVVFSGMAAGPAARVHAWQFAYGWRQSWDSAPYFTAYETGGNAPFLYAPQVVGISIGRIISHRILVAYYLAEVMNLLAFVALTWWALSKFPRRQAVALGLFLTLPMVSSLAISVNPDALLIALAAVFAAAYYQRWCATLVEGSAPRAPWNFWSDPYERVAALSVILMTIEKPPLILLVLLLPFAEHPLRLRRYVARTTILGAAAGVLYEAWSFLAHSPHARIAPIAGVTPARQLGLVLTHPGHDLSVVVGTLRVNGTLYVREFIAGIGWLDTWFPGWFYLVVAALLLVALWHVTPRPVTGYVSFVGSLGVVLLTALALMFTFYLVDSPYGATTITGFQGRYLLPLVPSLVAALAAVAPVVPRRQRIAHLLDEYGAIAVVSLQFLITTQFVMTLLSRYWY